MAGKTDRDYMNRALQLAAKGIPTTSPNPLVGAVIVSKGRIVGEGYHARAGSDHAEIKALKKAGSRALGGTLYISLEPCCHTGHTGPCTEAIIKSGLKRVVFSIKDPDSRVNGRGERQLRKAGLTVTRGLLSHEASCLNETYLTSRTHKRAFVILKTAQSLDGRIAAVTGDSKWISSKAALRYGHQLRAEVDAVAVGSETVRKDNPALTVRLVKGRNPYRVVLSSSLELPPASHLLRNNADGRTILVSTARAIDRFSASRKGGNLTYWEVPAGGKHRLDLREFLARACEFGVNSVLIEGGSRLATSFLEAGLVDKYVCIISPLLIGRGINSIGDLGLSKVAQAIRFKDQLFTPCGPDMIFAGYPDWSQ